MANLLPNPGFETNITGWVNFGATVGARSTVQAHSGVGSYLLTRADTSPSRGVAIINTARIPVSANTPYEWSCWVHASEQATIFLRMQYTSTIDSGGVTTTNNVNSGTVIPATTWTKLIYRTTSDALAVGYLGYAYTNTGSIGQSVYYDDFYFGPPIPDDQSTNRHEQTRRLAILQGAGVL